MAYLGQVIVEATEVGDLEVARVANEAVAKLLGTRDPHRAPDAEVVDLQETRGGR